MFSFSFVPHSPLIRRKQAHARSLLLFQTSAHHHRHANKPCSSVTNYAICLCISLSDDLPAEAFPRETSLPPHIPLPVLREAELERLAGQLDSDSVLASLTINPPPSILPRHSPPPLASGKQLPSLALMYLTLGVEHSVKGEFVVCLSILLQVEILYCRISNRLRGLFHLVRRHRGTTTCEQKKRRRRTEEEEALSLPLESSREHVARQDSDPHYHPPLLYRYAYECLQAHTPVHVDLSTYLPTANLSVHLS